MKEGEEMHLKSRINESTLSTAARSPFPNGDGNDTRIPLSPNHSLPRWGRLRYESTAIPDTKPSPRGEGGERSEPDRVLAV